MNNRLINIALAIVALLVVGTAAYTTYTRVQPVSSQGSTATSSTPTNTLATPPSQNSEATSISGVMTCLTPKDTSAPADMSCTIGLKADDGKSYALNASDPILLGSIPYGEAVRMSGTVSEQPSRFDISGVIQVSSMERR